MISIIVPAFNAEKYMARCLDGLRAQNNACDQFEVIVVDDGSTDATREIAQGRGARILCQANRGAAAARNLGAQNARGDIVLFLDGDCEPGPNWVAAMTAPFAEPSVVGVGGMKQTHQRGILPQFVQAEFDYRYDQVGEHLYIDFIDSGTAAYRRDIFLRHHGFDTSLMDAEDVELSFRLSEQGYKMAFARGAVVFHEHPQSIGEYLRRKFRYAYWRSFVYRRYPKKIASDSRTPQTQKIASALALILLPAIVGSLVWDRLVVVVALLGLMLLATTLPFVVRNWSRGWKIALVAPFLISLAAFAVGLGVALGALSRKNSKMVPPRLGPAA